MRRPVLVLLALAIQIAPALADGPTVIAGHDVLADIARRLAGDAATVTMPVPDGTDPAGWQPGIAEIGAVQAADLILLNGAGFEGWTAHVSLPRARTRDTTRALADAIITLPSVTHSHGGGAAHAHDALAPRVWLDFALAGRQAAAVAEALEPLAPGAAANLPAVTTDVAALDATAKAIGAALAGETLLADHPGYEYFARAYGMALVEVTFDPVTPASAAELAALDAAIAATGARRMLWHGAPPSETAAALAARSIAVLILPDGADTPEGQSALANLSAALAAILTQVSQP